MIRVIAKMMLAAGRWVWRWTSMNSYLACIHCVGLVFYGLEEARRISVLRRCSLGPSPWSTDTHSLHCWQSKWPWIHRPVAVIITRFRRSRVSQLEAKSASRSYKCRAMKMRAKILRKCHLLKMLARSLASDFKKVPRITWELTSKRDPFGNLNRLLGWRHFLKRSSIFRGRCISELDGWSDCCHSLSSLSCQLVATHGPLYLRQRSVMCPPLFTTLL